MTYDLDKKKYIISVLILVSKTDQIKITQRIRVAHAKAWAFLFCVHVLGRTLLTDRKCPTLTILTNFCLGTFEDFKFIFMEKFNTTNPYNPNNQKQDPKKLVISIIFSLIFLFIIIKCSCSENNNEEKVEVKKFEKLDALVQAHVHIQSLLKSPASAEFNPFGEEGVTKVNDTTFIVVGTVDSQNSYGAMLRSNFSCKVIFHPKDDTHNIENVILE